MNKRDLMFDLLDPHKPQTQVPAGFFLHFDPAFHEGQAAVDQHIAYYRYTGMDFVKIQYERTFPPHPEIQQPADWKHMPVYARDFYAGQLAAVEGLVRALGDEAVVMVTLYSPFMCAGHAAGRERLEAHLRADAEAVRPGLQAITDSLLMFVDGCIEAGVDGFYHSTQGGEASRFGKADRGIFETVIKPYDLALMQPISRRCAFNVLHVCDYVASYDDLTPFVDYPGHVVNAALMVGGQPVTPGEISAMFGRPFMGGLDRHGVLASGPAAAITAAVERVLARKSEKFILAADCTVPSDTPWDNLKTAIEAAHAWTG